MPVRAVLPEAVVGSKVENRRIQCKSWFFCLLATVGDAMDSVGFAIPVPENEI